LGGAWTVAHRGNIRRMIAALTFLLVRVLTLSAVGAVSTALMAAPRGDAAPLDDHGQSLRLAARPERIVSLAPHTTELLFAAGAGSRVIAVDPASDFPVAATQLPRVSAWPRPDLEALRGAAPDLILIWGAGLRAEQGNRSLGSRRFGSPNRRA